MYFHAQRLYHIQQNSFCGGKVRALAPQAAIGALRPVDTISSWTLHLRLDLPLRVVSVDEGYPVVCQSTAGGRQQGGK
jgi:hypothetical protein